MVRIPIGPVTRLFLPLFLCASVASASSGPAPAPAPTGYTATSPSKTVLGKALGGTYHSGLQPNQATGMDQTTTTVILKILGLALQALTALASPPNTIGGVTYTEFFVFNKRVFSQSTNMNLASDSFSLGLSPVEIRLPIVVYPVGPIPLEVDGGARFQADLEGTITPTIGIPVTLSSIGVTLTALADGAGFIEGYANLLILRAGVGGQVDLVNAKADLNTRVQFDGTPPLFSLDGMISFLSGRFYAFLDIFKLFGFKRLLDYSLFSWSGYCFATGSLMCPHTPGGATPPGIIPPH